MIIGIDGNEANLERRVGIGQYAFNILKNLSEIDTQNQYFIFLKSAPRPDMPPARPGWKYLVFGPEKMWTRLALPVYLYTFAPKLDLFYSPGHYLPLFCPCPVIPTIHDLGYLDTPEQFTKKDFYQLKNWTEMSLKKAARIMAVSVFTKNELVRIYHLNPDKIDIAYNGISPPPAITTRDSDSVLKKFKINAPYFLALGTLKPSKNIPFLIEAYSKTNLSRKLVIAGKKGWLFDEIFAAVKKYKLEKSVIFTDYITETEKWTLLKNADCTVIPSLYEGFGIPAIESLLVDTPVIVSDLPPFREVLGRCATYIDPCNLNSLVTALNNFKKYKSLPPEWSTILNSFTWSNSAQSLLKVFNKLN